MYFGPPLLFRYYFFHPTSLKTLELTICWTEYDSLSFPPPIILTNTALPRATLRPLWYKPELYRTVRVYTAMHCTLPPGTGPDSTDPDYTGRHWTVTCTVLYWHILQCTVPYRAVTYPTEMYAIGGLGTLLLCAVLYWYMLQCTASLRTASYSLDVMGSGNTGLYYVPYCAGIYHYILRCNARCRTVRHDTQWTNRDRTIPTGQCQTILNRAVPYWYILQCTVSYRTAPVTGQYGIRQYRPDNTKPKNTYRCYLRQLTHLPLSVQWSNPLQLPL